jgi:hypothetical protein
MKKTVTILLFSTFSTILYAQEQIPLEVKRIQDAKEQKINEIERLYRIALINQKDAYIKRQDFDSAKYIDNLLVELVDQDVQMESKNRKAHLFCKEKTTRIKKGERIFLEKSGVFHEIPEEFENIRITVLDESPTPSSPRLEFKIKKKGYVKIILDPRNVNEMESAGWEVLAKGKWGWAEPSRDMIFMEKLLDTGEYKISRGAGFGTRLIIE